MFKVFKQSHILVNRLLGLHSKSQIEIQLFWEINECATHGLHKTFIG